MVIVKKVGVAVAPERPGAEHRVSLTPITSDSSESLAHRPHTETTSAALETNDDAFLMSRLVEEAEEVCAGSPDSRLTVDYLRARSGSARCVT